LPGGTAENSISPLPSRHRPFAVLPAAGQQFRVEWSPVFLERRIHECKS
jgi:hypothetical protein